MNRLKTILSKKSACFYLTAKVLFIVLLFLVGVFHWAYFFDFGKLSFNAFDWPKEFKYYLILRESLIQRVIPYHISETFQTTNRFLALPETLVSPQVLVLPLMNVGNFIMINTILLYGIGFIGCLLIKKKYKLSWLSFTVLYLLFNYNGYITAHIAVGHSMWSGYFLLPLFCLFTLELLEEKKFLRDVVKLSLILFAILLQGAFHIFVWCVIFLLLVAIFNRKYLKPVLLIILSSILCSAFRIVPAAMTFYNKGYPFVFISGYRNVQNLFHALLSIRNYTYYPFVTKIGWWEFDAYLSIAGLAILIYFGIYLRFSNSAIKRQYQYKVLDFPLLTMFFLSLNFFYALIAELPIPFINSQRFSSRFIIIPMIFLMIISVMQLERIIRIYNKRAIFRITAIIIILYLSVALGLHSYIWRISAIESYSFSRIVEPTIKIIRKSDTLYTNSVNISLFASLVAMAILTYLAFLRKKLVDSKD